MFIISMCTYVLVLHLRTSIKEFYDDDVDEWLIVLVT